MPVVRHKNIGKDAHAIQLFCLCKKLFKMQIIIFFIKDGLAAIGSIDYMINLTSYINS